MVKDFKEHQLKGSILKKEELRNYQGRQKGQSYYNLWVDIAPKTKPAVFSGYIQAVRDKVLDDNIWNDILTDNFVGKKYLFICHKYGFTYKLVRWVEEPTKAQQK